MLSRDVEQQHLAQVDRLIREAEARTARFKSLLAVMPRDSASSAVAERSLDLQTQGLMLLHWSRRLIITALEKGGP